MSDTQSPVILEAKNALDVAQQEVWRAESALEDAQRAFSKAKTAYEVALEPITWKHVFVAHKTMPFSELQAMAEKSGYRYLLHAGHVFRTKDAEHTGLSEDDVK